MKLKKRIMPCLLAGILFIQCGALAANEPEYLYNEIIRFMPEAVAENDDGIIGIPREKQSFSYSFAEKEVQYSDFLIAPQAHVEAITLSYKSTKADHTLTIQLIDKETKAVVKEWPAVSVVCDNTNTMTFSLSPYLEEQHGYYVLLSNPSINQASGIFTVKMDGKTPEAVLRTLGIINGYENGEFAPERNITRAEMCKMIAKMLDYEDALPQQIFTDVPVSHWASPYIAFCYNKGIVNGKGENLFFPEENITSAEVLTMLVRAIGYKPEAEVRGGFPNGYVIIASREEITRGNSIIAAELMSRQVVADCLYNSLFVPLMLQDTQVEGESYIVMNGKDGISLDTLYLRFAKKESID